MAHDLVIRGGEVVDGTGSGPRRADVAIDGAVITTVGTVDGRGTRELDASGRIVTPGFVDIHTHLDAQLFWDGSASPSSSHGVTSVAIGNCGVTFAPVRGDSQRYLAEMMESVEDIPANTIMEGLDWSWESFGDYLEALSKRDVAINVGGLVGHCAVRYYVMGERSLEDAPATDEDIGQIAELVGDAMDHGALGFSTSRTFIHTTPDGRPVPGTFASPDELGAIAAELAKRGRGVIGAAARIGERDGPDRENSAAELAWMERVSRSSGRPVTFAIMQSDRRADLWSWVMNEVAEARGRGADLRPQTTARGAGILLGLIDRTPYDGRRGWDELSRMTLAEKLVALRDDAFRARLIEAADEPSDERGPLAIKDPSKFYLLPPGLATYDVSPANSLAHLAAARGVTPATAFVEWSLETAGRGLLYYPVLNQDLDAVAQMITNPNVLLGVADAGAHVRSIMDASQTTYTLTRWVRDQGVLDIGRAVRKLAAEGAELFGLDRRGVLAEGNFADVNVIDLDGLQLHVPDFVEDLPLGAARYVQRASGYDYTLVNGSVMLDHDELTGSRAGTILRPR